MDSHSEDNLNEMMNEYMEYAETNLSSSGGEEQGKERRRKWEDDNVKEKGKNVEPPEKEGEGWKENIQCLGSLHHAARL